MKDVLLLTSFTLFLAMISCQNQTKSPEPTVAKATEDTLVDKAKSSDSAITTSAADKEIESGEVEDPSWIDFKKSDLANYDLSNNVINPDSVPTDDVYSWWADEELEKYKSHGNPTKDRWYIRTGPLGFKGPGYQRFEIHYMSVERKDYTTYKVTGKTRCKDVIMPFDGEIILDAKMSFGPIEKSEYSGYKQVTDVGYIRGHYIFSSYIPEGKESSTRCKSADLFGEVKFQYIVHAGQIYYDGLGMVADGFENNQYEGIWIDVNTQDTVTCNWGDFRIPNSRGLDVGCGEFCPSDSARRYYGWDEYIESLGNTSPKWWE